MPMGASFANIQILKECEDGKLTVNEACIVIPITHKWFYDRANYFIAFDLELKNRDQAFDLVDALNELEENAESACWYVGLEGEEYVFVN